MRDDDLEERLRRALHAHLDGAEPPVGSREAGPRRAARVPFGLLAAAVSVVLVAALVGPKLVGVGGAQENRTPGPAAASPNPAVGAATDVGSAVPSGLGLLPGPSLATSASTGASAAIPISATSRPVRTTTPTVPVPVAPPPAATVQPLPRVTPTPTPRSTSGTVVVTLADAGGTIDLAVGQELILQFGTTYQWSIDVGGSGVLAPVSARLPAGVQGIWVAERSGTAQVQVVGNPLCLQLKPPCGLPSRAFTVTAVVH